MSEFKHTPGPWRTTPNGVVTSDSCQISHVGETSRPADMVCNFERWDADARLIAAAPDMLHALNLALEYWQDRQQRYKNRSPAWVQEARAAIAKALGETK